jgi:hypothetical protein
MARGVPNLTDAPAGLRMVAVSEKPLRKGVVLEVTSRPGTATVRLADGSVISSWLSGRLDASYFVGPDRFRFLRRLVGARVWVADCRSCSGPQTRVVQMVLPPAAQDVEPSGTAEGGGR